MTQSIKWISIEKKSPEEKELVLILDKNNDNYLAILLNNAWYIREDSVQKDKSIENIEITHWMYIPKPPKKP